MAQVLVGLFKGLVLLAVGVLARPDPLVNALCTDHDFPFLPYDAADQLRAPLLFSKQGEDPLLFPGVEDAVLGLLLMAKIRPALGIEGFVVQGQLALLRGVALDLPADSACVNTNLKSNLLL